MVRAIGGKGPGGVYPLGASTASKIMGARPRGPDLVSESAAISGSPPERPQEGTTKGDGDEKIVAVDGDRSDRDAGGERGHHGQTRLGALLLPEEQRLRDPQELGHGLELHGGPNRPDQPRQR